MAGFLLFMQVGELYIGLLYAIAKKVILRLEKADMAVYNLKKIQCTSGEWPLSLMYYIPRRRTIFTLV